MTADAIKLLAAVFQHIVCTLMEKTRQRHIGQSSPERRNNKDEDKRFPRVFYGCEMGIIAHKGSGDLNPFPHRL